jgi:hypothetical protein
MGSGIGISENNVLIVARMSWGNQALRAVKRILQLHRSRRFYHSSLNRTGNQLTLSDTAPGDSSVNAIQQRW